MGSLPIKSETKVEHVGVPKSEPLGDNMFSVRSFTHFHPSKKFSNFSSSFGEFVIHQILEPPGVL
jgi:hypothetical protein